MAKIIERSEYWFDPTANEAVARVDRKPKKNPSSNPYHASTKDIQTYQGVIFEPEQLISNRQLRKLHHTRNIR